jgi:hypothetical protein
MALGDKVERLQESVTTLVERVSGISKTLDGLGSDLSTTKQAISDLRRELEKEVALLKREVEELKNWRADQKRQGEEWGRRVWAFGPSLLAVLVSGLISAAIAFFLTVMDCGAG